MNKQQGLVIRPFRKAHITRENDRELLYLSMYLELIGRLDTLEDLRHSKWEKYLQEHQAEL